MFYFKVQATPFSQTFKETYPSTYNKSYNKSIKYILFRPVEYAVGRGKRFTVGLIILAWVLACFISLPMYIDINTFSGWTKVVAKEDKSCSVPVDPASRGYILYAGIAAFVIPTILLSTLYTAVGYQMRKRQRSKIGRAKTDLKMAVKIEVNRSELGSKMNLNKPDITPLHLVDSGFQDLPTPKRDFLAPNPQIIQVQTQSFQSLRPNPVQVDPDSRTSWRDTETSDAQGLEILKECDLNELKAFHKTGEKKSDNLNKAERKLRIEEKKQTRITMMMSVIVGTYALCWLPFAVMFFLYPYLPQFSEFMDEHETLINTITWVGYLNSLLNPVIYASMNKDIRLGMSRIMFSDKAAN